MISKLGQTIIRYRWTWLQDIYNVPDFFLEIGTGFDCDNVETVNPL